MSICTLDDEAVVFNPFSWETHLLNPAAALVLGLAAERQCSEEDVAGFLAEALQEGERPRAAQHAHQIIEELIALRLIVVMAPPVDAC